MEVKSRHKKRYDSISIFAGILTFSVLVLLLLSGPIKALTLELGDFSNASPTQGENVSTTATIEIRTDERLEFNNIQLHINSTFNYLCKFYVNGTTISGCTGITVEQLSDNTTYGYGYGYVNGYGYGGYGYNQGYSNGVLTYNITLDTSHFNVGDYNISLKTTINTTTFTSEVVTLTIDEAESSSSGGGGSTNEYKITEDQLIEGFSKKLSEGKQFKFFMNEEWHYITLRDAEEDSATITILPEALDVTLDVGEEEEIDVDGDGVADLNIKLNSISGSAVDITIKKIPPTVIRDIKENAKESTSEQIPSQLFDIKLELEETLLKNSDELAARVVFESFGKEPTPVDLTFLILDENGNEVHRSEETVIVETENVFRKSFKGLNLPAGKYTIVLRTLYSSDVSDQFKQEFEIQGNGGVIVYVLVTLTILVVAGFLIIRYKKNLIRIFNKKF
jgi:hypothetical protein